jgi:hypothetical protein
VLKRVFAALAISGREEKDLDSVILSFLCKAVTDEYQLPKMNRLSKIDGRYIRLAGFFAKQQSAARKKFTNENGEKYRKKRLDRLKAMVEMPHVVFNEHVELEEEETEPV